MSARPGEPGAEDEDAATIGGRAPAADRLRPEQENLDGAELAAGTRLGPYEIVGPLGAGGMATVYLAADAKHHRKVAVKVLKPGLAAGIGHERFAREIEIAAGLRHPRILPLYDSGEAAGLLFYVMPYVEGESLRDRLRRETRIELAEALRITSEVAEALAHAHSRDVIHRDIKPENILLEGGHALVMDFGIARAVMSAAPDLRMTMPGVALGTPLYMSPEQAMGDVEVDGRSDLYGLACVLFEMLAGAAPFSGGTAESVLVQRFTQPPPRLSSRLAGAPSRVDAALFRAMARNPADRQPTVVRFMEALCLPPGRAGGVAGAAEKSIAVLPFTNLSGAAEDEYFSDGVTEEIINALAQLDGLRVAARTSTFSFKGKNEDLRLIGEKLNVTTVLEGGVRRSGTRIRITAQLIDVADGYHLWSERYDRELTDIFAIQDEIAMAVAAKFKVELAREREELRVRRATANLEAYELYLKGRALQYRRGRSVVKALECFERAVELDPEFAEALAIMSDSYRLMSVYGLMPPREAMPQAKAAAERALALDADLAEAYATLADVAVSYDRDFAAGLRLWDRALGLSPDHIRARCEHALWGLLCTGGAFDAAVAECRRAIESDPLSAYAAGMHSLVLSCAGRHAEGIAEGRRAVELDPESFIARWMLLSALLGAGDFAQVVAGAPPALLMSGRHPLVLAQLAAALGHLGRRGDARSIYLELSARARSEYVQTYVLAAAAAAAGRLEQAMRLAERAADERDTLIMLSRYNSECKALRAHPRFGDLLRRLGFERPPAA